MKNINTWIKHFIVAKRDLTNGEFCVKSEKNAATQPSFIPK